MDDIPVLVDNSSITVATGTSEDGPLLEKHSSLMCSSGATNGFLNKAQMTNGNVNYLSDDSFEDDDDDLAGINDNDERAVATEEFFGTQTTECLLCIQTTKSPELMLSHMIQAHNFDLVKTCINYKVDHILFIKLINFIRNNKSSIEEMKSDNFNVSLLDDDANMVPAMEDDAFLRFGECT